MFIRYSLIVASLLLLSSCCQNKALDKQDVKQGIKSHHVDPEKSINNSVDNINRDMVNSIPPKPQ